MDSAPSPTAQDARCEKCGATFDDMRDPHYSFVRFENGAGAGEERMWCSRKCLPKNLRERA